VSNGLELLVFRLKTKDHIHTVLHQCHLLEYTSSKRVITVAIACDIYGALPANHLGGDFSNTAGRIIDLTLLGASGMRRVGVCGLAGYVVAVQYIVRKKVNLGDVIRVTR
jgi:hypothetical protein